MSAIDRVELAVVSVMTGTAKEVCRKLSPGGDRQVVAFLLPQSGVEQLAALQQTLQALVEITQGVAINRKRATLESLVNAFCPVIAEPRSVRREAEMAAKARAEVVASTEWLSAAQVSQVAGLSSGNPNAQPSRWKRSGKIFSIKLAGSAELFPGYGLDPRSGYRPRKELAEIIKIFGAQKDGWGLAYWFASVNGYLGGKSPQEVLLQTPRRVDAVIAAAMDEVAEIKHG